MSTPLCTTVSVLSIEKHSTNQTAQTKQAGGDLYSLRLSSPGWAGWKAGQFVMVRPKNKAAELTWARPFSIAYADDTALELFFQETGRGTAVLASLCQGDELDIWGPLGNSFAVEEGTETLLLAGGIGLAPFIGYIAQHPTPQTLHLDFGHRQPLECYPFSRCSSIDAHNHMECAPEDLECFIDTLGEGIRRIAEAKGLVLACGPMPFLRTIQRLAAECGARAQLSLETRMACGVGACLGCVVKHKNDAHHQAAPSDAFDWVQTCTCGPVFWAHELDLEGNA